LGSIFGGTFDHRLGERHGGVAGDRGLERLLHEVAGQLLAHALAEHALEHLRGHLAGAEARQSGTPLQVLHLGGQAPRDLVPGDLHLHPTLDLADPFDAAFHRSCPKVRRS
jgi:hypothetical protein